MDGPSIPESRIIVERRPRSGCLRLLFLAALTTSLLLNMSLISREIGGDLPNRLPEHYVAGDADLTSPKIALIEIHGVILEDGSSNDPVALAVREIRQARDDSHVKAIVLRIDSPGGTVSGSDRIWREAATVRKGDIAARKPIIVSMGGVAASGGYYIASAADSIFAEPTTMTGSIGVIMQLPQVADLMKKIGVGVDTITTGDWKDSGSMFRPMTSEERDRWKVLLDAPYQRFVRIVAQGRGIPLKDAKAAADGKVFTAQEALKRKLIDEIGYLDDALREAQKRAGLDKARVVRFQKPIGLVNLFTGSARSEPLKIDAKTLLEMETPKMYYLARSGREFNSVQIFTKNLFLYIHQQINQSTNNTIVEPTMGANDSG